MLKMKLGDISFLEIVKKLQYLSGRASLIIWLKSFSFAYLQGRDAFVFVFVVSTRFAGDAACPASYQICPKTGFQDAAIAAAVIIAIIAFALGIVIMKIVIIFIVTTMATTTIIIVVPTFSFLSKAPKATNNFKSEFVLLPGGAISWPQKWTWNRFTNQVWFST